jgi:hypothetical protein
MPAKKKSDDDELDAATELMVRLNVLERDNQRLREELKEKDKLLWEKERELMASAEEEKKRRERVLYANIASYKAELKAGRLSKELYEFMRDRPDTKTTRRNIVEAFKAYRRARREKVNEDLTFGKMLEEMKAILAENEGELEGDE